MDKKAQLEQFVWNAAKNPDSAAAKDFIQNHTGSVDDIRRIRDEARIMRDQSVAISGTTTVYRISPEQYQGLMDRMRKRAIERKILNQWSNIEALK